MGFRECFGPHEEQLPLPIINRVWRTMELVICGRPVPKLAGHPMIEKIKISAKIGVLGGDERRYAFVMCNLQN
jgi:hypothetical protein